MTLAPQERPLSTPTCRIEAMFHRPPKPHPVAHPGDLWEVASAASDATLCEPDGPPPVPQRLEAHFPLGGRTIAKSLWGQPTDHSQERDTYSIPDGHVIVTDTRLLLVGLDVHAQGWMHQLDITQCTYTCLGDADLTWLERLFPQGRRYLLGPATGTEAGQDLISLFHFARASTSETTPTLGPSASEPNSSTLLLHLTRPVVPDTDAAVDPGGNGCLGRSPGQPLAPIAHGGGSGSGGIVLPHTGGVSYECALALPEARGLLGAATEALRPNSLSCLLFSPATTAAATAAGGIGRLHLAGYTRSARTRIELGPTELEYIHFVRA